MEAPITGLSPPHIYVDDVDRSTKLVYKIASDKRAERMLWISQPRTKGITEVGF